MVAEASGNVRSHDVMQKTALKLLVLSLTIVCVYVLTVWILVWHLVDLVEKRHKVQIHGILIPDFVRLGRFEVRGMSLDWPGRFVLKGDRVEVETNPSAWFFLSLKDARIRGMRLKVVLGETYRNFAKDKEFEVEKFSVRFDLPISGDLVVHDLEIDSPALKFDLKGK